MRPAPFTEENQCCDNDNDSGHDSEHMDED